MPKREKAGPSASGRRTTRRTSARKAKPEIPPTPLPPSPTPAETPVAHSPEAPPLALPPAPEIAFAARVAPPEPERPRPSGRRAVFFDVENTSRSSDVKRMLEQLAIDRAARATELVASGNWRVIGYETARLLAGHGAHLVHSAPATGVRDWSDLRIAVAAGVWLASARPGDELDVVSDDRAFDVLGDAAAALGVVFRRLSYRDAARAERAIVAAATGTRRRGRGRRSSGQATDHAVHAQHAARRAHPARAAHPEDAGDAGDAGEAGEALQALPAAGGAGPVVEAGDDQVLSAVKDLVAASPSGVTLNAVANRLRELGFQRSPGSPRLVTRLRALKELDVSPRGMIRLRGAPGADAGLPEPSPGTKDPAAGAAGLDAQSGGEPSQQKVGRRRGGRGRGRAKTPA
jgi:hypothetical protein